jgi:hypothetical protein
MRFFKAKAAKEADVPGGAPVENVQTILPEINTSASDTNVHSPNLVENSNPSSEKHSTLFDEPSRDSTADDEREKEIAISNPSSSSSSSPSSPNLALTDPNKESVGKEVSCQETTQEEKKEDGDNESVENEDDYPEGWKLFLITIALCLCVFCLALVCFRVNIDQIDRP